MDFEKLFDLAKPYLEKNEFGFEHTKRVYKIAKKYFSIPDNLKDLTFFSIILHDVGGSNIKAQYQKGPKIARNLLKKLQMSQDLIEKVCDIIRTHHNHPNNPSVPFRIIYDSDKLVMFTPEEFPYYNSFPNFDWNKIIELIYTDKMKLLAKEFLERRLKNL